LRFTKSKFIIKVLTSKIEKLSFKFLSIPRELTSAFVIERNGSIDKAVFDLNAKIDRLGSDLHTKIDKAVFDLNAKFHRSEESKKIIKEVGHQLLFLPSYSPDLNPIEKHWANLKVYPL